MWICLWQSLIVPRWPYVKIPLLTSIWHDLCSPLSFLLIYFAHTNPMNPLKLHHPYPPTPHPPPKKKKKKKKWSKRRRKEVGVGGGGLANNCYMKASCIHTNWIHIKNKKQKQKTKNNSFQMKLCLELSHLIIPCICFLCVFSSLWTDFS